MAWRRAAVGTGCWCATAAQLVPEGRA